LTIISEQIAFGKVPSINFLKKSGQDYFVAGYLIENSDVF